MTSLLLIRHAPTAWNAEGRIQGQTDVPLSAEGRALAATWRLPAAFAGHEAVTSPLRRTIETAALMGLAPVRREPRIAELHHGRWQGRRMAELRAEDREGFRRREDEGLEFRAPGGERRRELMDRIAGWMADLAAVRRDTVAVSHNGVLHMALALATGWDYRGEPPAALKGGHGQHFELDGTGRPRPVALNLPLRAP